MPPICCICIENKINNNNRCNTCKKSICDECYTKMSVFDLTNREMRYKYKCGFCKSETLKKIDDLDRVIICNELEKHVLNNMILIDKYDRENATLEVLNERNDDLEDENEKLMTEINQYKAQIRVLQSFNKKLLSKIQIDEIVKEVSIKKPNKYNIYFKENFARIKAVDPNKHSSLIMKEIGILWQKKKNEKSI